MTVSGNLETLVLELLNDQRALDELIQRIHLRLAHLLDQLVAGVIATELLDDRLDELPDFAVRNDLVVHDGGHPVDNVRRPWPRWRVSTKPAARLPSVVHSFDEPVLIFGMATENS